MNDLDCVTRARALNDACACALTAPSPLASRLTALEPELAAALLAERPHLFSESMVFISEAEARRIAEVIAAVEAVVARPAYPSQVLEQAPAVARQVVANRGAFLGFDFHLGPQGPQLIEINTNPGGGLLIALLDAAQQACCADIAQLVSGSPGRAAFEVALIAMFRAEWEQARRPANADFPRTVAIVDETPESQYLYPEFQLFQRLFAAAGSTALIVPPEALVFRRGALWHGEQRIDLVYNRLTDFYFEAANAAALREAYLADAVVITPQPRAHALYADKRNLVLFSDPAALAALGVEDASRDLLVRHVPRTRIVRPEDADVLWAERRQLFFKPVAGFGSKAAYRGDKLTRRVFDEILAADYVAQALVPPSLRTLRTAAGETATAPLKLDLRAFAYAGKVQLFAARLWQGQTTNFRTPGGGFAAVRIVPCTDERKEQNKEQAKEQNKELEAG
ncbi:MAG: hypothetical protein CVU17_10530 [Betaproteobacteria bacterium HGW-Betaproteobacteria-11]|nr:MAG: hypothetical protein CVU17_10530 [Betaproteobacteria bacterium HGW-Betaproteobacteria-11]